MESRERFVMFVPKLSRRDGMGYAALLSISSIKLLGDHLMVFCYEHDESEPYNMVRMPMARNLVRFPRWTFNLLPDVNSFSSLAFQYMRLGDLFASLLHGLVSARVVDVLRRADVIYYHLGSFDTFGPAALYSKIKGGSKLIVEYHGLPPPMYLEGVLSKLSQRSALKLSRQIMKEADAIIVHSSFTYEECSSLFGVRPTHKLPLGIDLAKFIRTHDKEKAKTHLELSGRKILLFVGRLVSYKRVDFLVKAMKSLKKRFSNILLLIVGSGKTTRYVHLARDMGVSDSVQILGDVPDLIPYYESADLFVTASLHEGFCLPVAEAQAFGVPVIATRSGALPETIDDGGLFFEPFSFDDFVGKVTELLNDLSVYRCLQRNALLHSRLRDKNITIQRLSEVISSVI